MKKTKSFYGFTANCTPMQRGKKEEQLSKLFKNDGVVYRFADFAVFMQFEKGYKATTKTITHGMVNGYYGKEWGELSKPRTEYRLESDTDCLSYTINKTLYDYCNYIVDTFKTLNDAVTYAENERLEQEKARAEAEEAEKRRREEAEEQKQRAKEHRDWMHSEREKYINTPIEAMCKAVFDYCYGENNTAVCCDVVILAKDIENPLSRKALIERLHNDNKASIKIFEQFTGIKLPKNYKERIEFLTTVQPKQYGEMTEFKPRKKAEKKTEQTEKQLEKYYKRMWKDGSYEETYGEKIGYNNLTFFAEKTAQKHYAITEATTGVLLISDGALTSIAKCKAKIKELCDTRNIAKCIEDAIAKGYKSPLYEAVTA